MRPAPCSFPSQCRCAPCAAARLPPPPPPRTLRVPRPLALPAALAPWRGSPAARRFFGEATAPGEQAWHRRARRQRQAARALLAVDAARRRLAAHHGGGGGGNRRRTSGSMPRRTTGGGGGHDPEFSLRQGLRELLERIDGAPGGGAVAERGRTAGRQQASRGGGSVPRGGGGGAVGGERRPQLGDWSCRACSFHPNFARRRTCYQCGRQRSPRGEGGNGARGGSGLTRGPIGADGLRPLLGGRAVGTERNATVSAGTSTVQRAPSFRVPGASIAARAATGMAANGGGGAAKVHVGGANDRQASTAQRCGSGNGEAAPPAGAATGARTTCDADGFQTVTHRRGWRRHKQTGDDGDDAATSGPHDGATTTATNDDGGPPRDADDCDDDADDDTPTAAQLHQAWHDELAVVKRLRQQGIASDHPAMQAACRARDDAERAWRENKAPTPPSLRLSRVQTKLDRAIALQAEARQAIVELEKAHKAQLEILQGRMDEATERVRARRLQLEQVQDQVATNGRGSQAGAAQGEAVRKVHSAICDTVAPVIATLIENLDSSTPAWTALNGIMGTLADSKSLLEKAIPPVPAARSFNIAGDDWDEEGGDGHDDDDDSTWSESHELQDDGKQTCSDAPTAQAGTTTTTAGRLDEGEHSQAMETDDWWGASYGGGWGTGVRWEATGHGKWARTSWADSWEREQEEDAAETAHPPTARRRLEPAAPETGAAEEAAGTSEARDAAARRQQHQERVQKVILAAIDAGVQPLSETGEELHMLDENQLSAWAAEHLASDKPYW